MCYDYLGFPCSTPDGYFGNNTETAVRNFQSAHNLTSDGLAGSQTLIKLNQLSPDTTTEHYGRELYHSEWSGGYSTPGISAIESLARTIYGEDTIHSAGQQAVAKEIYNRLYSPRSFTNLAKTWKGIVFGANQYAVVTGPASDTINARGPNQYSTQWQNCVTLATNLVNGQIPGGSLGKQCFHLSSDSSYPSNSLPETRIQIPAGIGNKFFDYQIDL